MRLVFTDLRRAGNQPDDAAAAKIVCGIHGISPLLGSHVQAGTISFDDELDTWLIEQSERNLTRLTLMRHELQVTLDAFKRTGIAIIPLKGAAMILDDLNAVAWRPMADLDVLVRH